jgi:hypothetical protein
MITSTGFQKTKPKCKYFFDSIPEIYKKIFFSMIQCIMATKEMEERQRKVEERDIRNG